MDNKVVNAEGSEKVRLTQFSRGAGCGCKIAPKVLDEILKTNIAMPADSKLLVGNSSKDDAAVYDLGNGTALISTTDFFMPIVDELSWGGRLRNFLQSWHKKFWMAAVKFVKKPVFLWLADIALTAPNPFFD